MNALTADLMKLAEQAERMADQTDRFRQSIHLMPPTGWLNDPNGLCCFQGVCHAFFQYSPFNANGGVKMWGHYTSRNMTEWQYEGVTLYPDQPFDCHGVYSGSAFVEDGTMYIYYTGNVKLEDGTYDYINTGRESNTVLVTSRDGKTFGRKQLLMRNSDYPSDVTLHVRDPKVWKEQSVYYMIQGARTKEHVGQALLFRSEDRVNWKYESRLVTEKAFGYMWECPDYFELDGMKILSVSVQGLEGGRWDERNIYQSGYFSVEGDIHGKYALSDYVLLDYGFDYYAPQSFETEDGRRVQIAWMGMPDCEEYVNQTTESCWQHCFTYPRELYVSEGTLRQRPVRELEEKKRFVCTVPGFLDREGDVVYEADIRGIRENQFRAVLAEELVLSCSGGKFEMRFTDPDKKAVSGGRNVRYENVGDVSRVQILADRSSVEVFVNDGKYVFTTRYYPKKYSICVEADGAQITFSEITE